MNAKHGENIDQQLTALDQLSELAKCVTGRKYDEYKINANYIRSASPQNPSEGPKSTSAPTTVKAVTTQDEIPTAVGIFSTDHEEDEGLEEIPFNEARIWLTEPQKRIAYSKVSVFIVKNDHRTNYGRCS